MLKVLGFTLVLVVSLIACVNPVFAASRLVSIHVGPQASYAADNTVNAVASGLKDADQWQNSHFLTQKIDGYSVWTIGYFSQIESALQHSDSDLQQAYKTLLELNHSTISKSTYAVLHDLPAQIHEINDTYHANLLTLSKDGAFGYVDPSKQSSSMKEVAQVLDQTLAQNKREDKALQSDLAQLESLNVSFIGLVNTTIALGPRTHEPVTTAVALHRGWFGFGSVGWVLSTGLSSSFFMSGFEYLFRRVFSRRTGKGRGNIINSYPSVDSSSMSLEQIHEITDKVVAGLEWERSVRKVLGQEVGNAPYLDWFDKISNAWNVVGQGKILFGQNSTASGRAHAILALITIGITGGAATLFTGGGDLAIALGGNLAVSAVGAFVNHTLQVHFGSSLTQAMSSDAQGIQALQQNGIVQETSWGQWVGGSFRAFPCRVRSIVQHFSTFWNAFK